MYARRDPGLVDLPLLAEANVPMLPAASEDRAAFAPLSAQFEAVWYGGRIADAGAFADAMNRLHALGCPQA